MSADSSCDKCGARLENGPDQCPTCGHIQDSFFYTSKTAAAVLAFFGGNFGLHRFYLRQWWGIFYLMFFWTYVPALVGFVEAFVFALRSQSVWNDKYNRGISAGTERGGILLILFVVGLIASIGILAAIALPAYQDYIIRSKMSEPLAALAEAKTGVADYVARGGRLPNDFGSLDIGMGQRPDSDIIASLSAHHGLQTNTVKLVANVDSCTWKGGSCDGTEYRSFHLVGTVNSDGSMTWACRPGDNDGANSMEIKYLPANCRK